jgi:hypothetical protein
MAQLPEPAISRKLPRGPGAAFFWDVDCRGNFREAASAGGGQ